MTPLLSVQNLHYERLRQRGWFKRAELFHLADINFQLERGESLAIIGDNGSGKSTLANLLVGALAPSRGDIFLNGQKLSYRDVKQRCLNIRMVFQHSSQSLNPALTLSKMLEEPLILNTDLDSEARELRIMETLKQVGLLPEHRYFYRHMLSDGQRQRVALARALVLNPQIIVADEPFAALDPSVRSQTVNLLMKLQKELGLGFVFISHNLGLVRHISDRMLILQDGRVVESGKTEVIFNWPQSEYTKRILDAYYSLVERRYR